MFTWKSEFSKVYRSAMCRLTSRPEALISIKPKYPMRLSLFACIQVALMWSSLSHGQAGAFDPSFGGGDGLVATSLFSNQSCFGYAIAIQEDGKIVVAGSNENASHFSSVIVFRYNTDGSLDPSFNGSGKLVVQLQNTQGYLRSMIIQPDQKILLCMSYEKQDEVGLKIHRILPDGSPDTAFHGDGFATVSFGASHTIAQAITLQTDGKILVCGYFGFDNDPDNKVFVMRFTSDGTPDSTFGIDGLFSRKIGESYSDLYDIEVQQDDKILCAGFAIFNNNDEFTALRLTSAGNIDFSYSDDGIAYAPMSEHNDRAYGLVIQPDGKAVLAGQAYNDLSSAGSFALARLNPDGSLDGTFHGDGINIFTVSGYADGATTVVLQPDGKIVMGGYVHSNVNGGADMAIVRVLPNGIPDSEWSEDGIANYADDLETSSVIHQLSIQPDGLISGTGFVQRDGISAVRVARFVSGIVTSTKEFQEAPPVKNLGCSPNPFYDQINVTYTLTAATAVQVTLRSLDGKVLEMLMPATLKSSGSYAEQIGIPSGLPDGIYFLSIETSEGIQSLEVIKVKG